MEYLYKTINLIIEKYEEIMIFEYIIFCVMLIGIALVIDLLLTHTFPALTLIGFIFSIGTISMKAYRNYLIRKNRNEVKEDFKNYKI